MSGHTSGEFNMPKPVLLLKVFLASPNDVTDARDAVRKILYQLNKSLAIPNGLCIDVVGWETDLEATFEGPQPIVNNMVRDADLFIGLVGNRFGTPTGRAGSGTEEEFDIGRESYEKGNLDDIKLYFRKTLSVNNLDEAEQARQVSKWIGKLQRKGELYLYMYKDSEDLIDRLLKDLTSWIDSWSKIIGICDSIFTKTIKVDVDMDRLFGNPLLDLERQLNPLLVSHSDNDHHLHDAESKSWFLEELAYHCYIELDRDTMNRLRIWSQILKNPNLGYIELGQDFAKTLIPYPPIFYSMQIQLQSSKDITWDIFKQNFADKKILFLEEG